MPAIKVLHGQAWIDICLQELGDESRLFELCELNNAGITDCLTAGTFVQVPNYETSKKNIVQILRQHKPASFSCNDGSNDVDYGEGIEFWAIENEFEVR